jgi:hypothetical protein
MKEIYQTKSEIAITYKLYNDLKKEIDDINSEISKLVIYIQRIMSNLFKKKTYLLIYLNNLDFSIA